nr:unnamed protein product [Callosobruchus analis]
MFGCDPCNRDSGDGRACLQCNAIFERQITLDEHILRTHPNSIASVTSKILSGCFKEHLSKHPETSSNKFSTCTHCDATFKRKSSLDNHLIKQHPNFISSVTNKIHKCTKCSYETTISSHLKSHLSKHSETPAICTFSKCLHCKASFRKKISLDDHILKNHPNFVSSVTSKVHKCTKCNFETTMCTHLKRHLMTHAETPDKHLLSTCAFCHAPFKSRTSLDDHILKKHPTFIASVTSKIHECGKCTFKTAFKNDLNRHSLKHQTRSKYKLSTCTHCKLTFKRKHWLDNHVIRKHPNFIDSVTSKVHECTLCGFKTTISAYFKRHMLKHPETISYYNFSTCTHCDRSFRSKSLLDNHLIKKHPKFISSVTNKIHKCTVCSYETTISTNLRNHLLIHTKTSAICRPITCTHCKASFNKKISLDDHIIKYHPNFASSVTSKIHKCTKCNFETTMCTDLKRHSMKHAETPDKHMLSTCRFCQAMFKSKTSVDDHILRKHPTFIASVTSKIHDGRFKKHLLKHSEPSSDYNFSTCTHCNLTFKRKHWLDNHVIRKHPNFIDSVTSKVHECILCGFKTTISAYFKRHMLKHPETSSNYRFSTCTHCDRTFKTKSLLDNHLIKKHPNFVSSVTNKIHKCTMCRYETTASSHLKSHLSRHSETPGNCQKITCPHCKAKFRRRTLLDNHVIKKHPNFVSSVTSKIYKCTKCAFETTINTHLKRHSLKHTETRPNHRPNTCALCHASFKTKRTLDNHTLQKHPKFIDSVTSKIHECTLCTFKTTMNAGFKEHLLKHPETISSYKFSACTHCDQTFKRKYLLDNHVLKKHPNVISSAINKIYKCTECNYETTISASLRRHMKVHSKTLPNLTCVQCNTTFKRKIFLDDHIVKKHPDFMESVTSRIHECRKCTFKTAFRNDLNRHSLNHLETAPSL